MGNATRSPSGPTDEFLARLGENVRSRRLAGNLTVQQLADAAGLSRRMLTQIELGQANPSLGTVDKVARALDLDFASLVAGSRPDPLEVNPPDSAVQVWASAAGSTTAFRTATTQERPAELWDSLLQPGDRYQALPDPPGSEELLLVVQGELTLEMEGHEPTRIPTGGSVRLATDRSYAYGNDGPDAVRFVRVVHLGPI